MSYTAAVITISDKGYRGERADTSGPALCAMLKEAGYNVVHTSIIPDDRDMIKTELLLCADEQKVALVLTTGGTGFSPRDITPEATLEVIERRIPGIPEAMRAESMRITPRGCLSRGIAGIRGRSLIVNLPGSEKAVRENLAPVLDALGHGVKMLRSNGSADCAAPPEAVPTPRPSVDQWLREAKADPAWSGCGMYLIHNGVVRETARAQVRDGEADLPPVRGMVFSCDRERLASAVEAAKALPGIGYVRVWVNGGRLAVGDDIMLVLVGGDIRPHVLDALEHLVSEIKETCVAETEIF